MRRYLLHKRRTKTGIGLVAGEDIPKGKKILEYQGKLIRGDDLPNSSYLMDVTIKKGRKCTIDGSPRSNIARYINHACRPNCEARRTDRQRVFIYTIKRIGAGVELTIDYGREYFDEYLKGKCLCSACTDKR